MAEAFPETPMIVEVAPKPVEPRAPAGFFPDSPRPAGEAPVASSYADPNGGDSEPADRQEYVFVEGDDEDDEDEATLEVRSGRLDTLGWVSASWEPRCVILRADGSMSVQPLGRARKKLSLHQLHQQQRARWGGSGIGGVYGADSTQSSPARAHWSPMMAKLKGRSNGNVVPTSSSTTNITDRLTTWASNSSSNSIRSASSNRLTSSFLASITAAAAGPGGTGGGANSVAESPGSSVSSANGHTEKVIHK